jgi:hypothetical protein
MLCCVPLFPEYALNQPFVTRRMLRSDADLAPKVLPMQGIFGYKVGNKFQWTHGTLVNCGVVFAL